MPVRSPSGYAACEVYWILLLCCFKLVLDVLFLEPFGRDSGTSQSQTLPVNGPGEPVWSYKVIYTLRFPLLGLDVYGEDQAVHQDWLLPTLGLSTGQQMTQVTLRYALACLSLLAAC